MRSIEARLFVDYGLQWNSEAAFAWAAGLPRRPQWTASLYGIDRAIDFFTHVEPVTPWVPATWSWIPWAAGLFEAEGCATFTGSPVLSITSTDLDVVERLPPLLGGKVYGPYYYGPPRKPIFKWLAEGRASEVAGRVLWPWAGSRRRRRMKEVILDRVYFKSPGQSAFLQESSWI